MMLGSFGGICRKAGHQHAHKGMTSRDLTENVEQLQIHRALSLILEKGLPLY